MRRREFCVRTAFAGMGVLTARALSAQERVVPAPAQGTTSNLFDMDQGAAKTVRRPPKRGATASLTPDERDALERQIRCQCGCTLDVYICRTTDFACQVSPAMHRDIISLVEGGYSAQEILDAFVASYGERALMSPKREGFNLVGYLAPFLVLGVGAVGLTVVLRRMRRHLESPRRELAAAPPGATATADEIARLQAAVRHDE
jgi:cytochrome c-type biogenesis protein CcmH